MDVSLIPDEMVPPPLKGNIVDKHDELLMFMVCSLCIRCDRGCWAIIPLQLRYSSMWYNNSLRELVTIFVLV